MALFSRSILAFFSPPLAAVWAFRRSMSWRGWLVVASLLGNVLFAVFLILVFLVDDSPEPAGVAGESLAPSIVASPSVPLRIGTAAPESELERVAPHTWFVVFRGGVLSQIEFDDESYASVKSVTVSDRFGRSRISYDMATNAVIQELYARDDSRFPEIGLRDIDGDGIPDVRIEWSGPASFKRLGEVQWVPATATNATPERGDAQ